MKNFLRLCRVIALFSIAFVQIGCQTQGGLRNAQGDPIKLTFAAIARGEARLTCNTRCSDAWDMARNYAKQLYEDKSWMELAHLVGQVGFNSDQSYFYLGRSAEELGFPAAARIYYQLGQASKTKCADSGHLCDGLNIGDELQTRPLIVDAFWNRTALMMKCMDQSASQQYAKRIFSRIPDYGVNELDRTGMSVLISAAIDGRHKANVPAKDIALSAVAHTSGAINTSFLVIKKVIESIGYAVEWDKWANRKASSVLPNPMAITIDEQKRFVLVTEINHEQAHLMYTDGQVCVVPVSYFLNGPEANVFLEIVGPAQKSSRLK